MAKEGGWTSGRKAAVVLRDIEPQVQSTALAKTSESIVVQK